MMGFFYNLVSCLYWHQYDNNQKIETIKMKKNKLAKSISAAVVGVVITTGSISTALASSTSYHLSNGNWASQSGADPFTITSPAHWVAEITAAGDSLTVSSQDAQNRYGVWPGLKTAKGAWFDGTNGWAHHTAVGLFKSDVAVDVTINITALPPQGSTDTWSNFGMSVYTGMAEGYWNAHATWNCPTCTSIDSNGIEHRTAPTYTDDNPFGGQYEDLSILGLTPGTGLTYLKHDGTVDDNLNDITFHAEAGQVYTLLLGGNSGLGNFSPVAGYSVNIATSAVPLPAAVWLFGGALAWLTGLQGRKFSLNKSVC